RAPLASRAVRLLQCKGRRSRASRPGRLDQRPSDSCQSQGRWIAAGIINERMETAQIIAKKTPPSAMKRRRLGIPSASPFHFVQLAAPADTAAAKADPMTRYRTHRCPLAQIERVATKLNSWAAIQASTGVKAKSQGKTSSRSTRRAE